MNRLSQIGIYAAIFLVCFYIIPFCPKKALAAITINSISPSSISSPDDIVALSVSASSLQNSTQYLEVGFTKEGETANYFGFTKNLNDEWYQYKTSPSTTDLSSYFYSFLSVSGSWSGQVQTKIDISDSGYKGAGNYTVRLSKFITSSATYSNTVTLVVNITPTSTPTPTNTPTPSPTNTPTPTKTPTPVPSSTPTSTPIPTLIPTNTLSPTATISATEGVPITLAVLGESTKEPSKGVEVLVGSEIHKKKNGGIFLIIGGIIFLASCGILAYRIYKNKDIKNLVNRDE